MTGFADIVEEVVLIVFGEFADGGVINGDGGVDEFCDGAILGAGVLCAELDNGVFDLFAEDMLLCLCGCGDEDEYGY